MVKLSSVVLIIEKIIFIGCDFFLIQGFDHKYHFRV